MKRVTCCSLAIPLAVLLSVSAARGEVKFEETEFAGWTTGVFGATGRTVSGTTQLDGGNPAAHYLVRHTHQRFESFPFSASSASFSPRGLDPGELGLATTPRFSVDLRLEVNSTGAQTFAPKLYWTPAVLQGERFYRYLNPAEVAIPDRNVFIRVEVDLHADKWAGGGPDVSPGALPIRPGLVLQSDVGVAPGTQAEVRIGVDNLRIETPDEGDLPRVTLVTLPSPGGDRVVFAPPPCFDGTADRYNLSVDVDADVSRDWYGCVGVQGPNLTFSSEVCFGREDAPRQGRASARCHSNAPTRIELLSPASGRGALLGFPSKARLEPCFVRVPGGYVPCNEFEDVCVAKSLFYLACGFGPGRVSCMLPDDGINSVYRREIHAATEDDFGVADAALDTLRSVRDERLSATPAGRYYRDLYDAFSPELRDIVMGDLRLIRDALAAAPAWLRALGDLVDGDGDAIVTPAMTANMLTIFDRFETKASPALRELFQRERARLRLQDFTGRSIEEAFALVEDRGDPPACTTSESALCVQGGRFRVEVTWTDFQGRSGSGRAVPLSSDSGYFWFFNRENIELAVKVLDGRAVNGRFWVFYGALSNVEYTVLVTDTATGAVRAYRNPSRVFASVGDTGAFTPDGAPREVDDSGEEHDDPALLADLTRIASDTLHVGWRNLRRVVLPGLGAASVNPLLSGADLTLASSAAHPRANCLPTANALCLAANRFRVEVEWRDFRGRTGFGMSKPLTTDTGAFWFFNTANTELIVKVLDGRAVNDHFWVFYGALSNVEYTLRVTDTLSGAVRTYRNPSGTFASRGDVEAF
jgi:hypothetical protein